MNFNSDIFDQDVFKNIEPERIEMFKQFVNKVQGKNMNEVMMEFMSFYKKMPKGREFSREEKDALISAIYSNLSSSDRVKFNSILSLMGHK